MVTNDLQIMENKGKNSYSPEQILVLQELQRKISRRQVIGNEEFLRFANKFCRGNGQQNLPSEEKQHILAEAINQSIDLPGSMEFNEGTGTWQYTIAQPDGIPTNQEKEEDLLEAATAREQVYDLNYDKLNYAIQRNMMVRLYLRNRPGQDPIKVSPVALSGQTENWFVTTATNLYNGFMIKCVELTYEYTDYSATYEPRINKPPVVQKTFDNIILKVKSLNVKYALIHDKNAIVLPPCQKDGMCRLMIPSITRVDLLQILSCNSDMAIEGPPELLAEFIEWRNNIGTST